MNSRRLVQDKNTYRRIIICCLRSRGRAQPSPQLQLRRPCNTTTDMNPQRNPCSSSHRVPWVLFLPPTTIRSTAPIPRFSLSIRILLPSLIPRVPSTGAAPPRLRCHPLQLSRRFHIRPHRPPLNKIRNQYPINSNRFSRCMPPQKLLRIRRCGFLALTWGSMGEANTGARIQEVTFLANMRTPLNGWRKAILHPVPLRA